jgi:hypothetical protein
MDRKLTYIFLIIFLSNNILNARENPFIATQTFIDEKEAILEEQELIKNNKLLLKYRPYSFIDIEIYEDKIKIQTPNTKLFRHFKIQNENKIVLDFKRINSFYTKSELIDNTNIKQIIIGDHPEEDFFRVVIVLKTKLYQYHIDIDKSTLSINYLN